MRDRILERRIKIGVVFLFLIIFIVFSAWAATTLTTTTVTTGSLTCTQFITPYNNTVVVAKQGGDYSTIQGAINSISGATASNKSGILIYPGIYSEKITGKSYVGLTGMGARGAVIIRSTTGPLYTFPVHGGNIRGMRFELFPTTAGQVIFNISSGNHKMWDIKAIIKSSTNGINGSIVDMDSGFLDVIASNYQYNLTGNSVGVRTHNILDINGNSKLRFESCEFEVNMSDIDDDICMLNTTTTSTDETRFLSSEIHINATNAGYVGNATAFCCSSASKDQNIHNCHIHVTSPSGTGTGRAVLVDSGGNSAEIHLSANNIRVEGFGTNYFADVDATDRLVSHFDDVVAVDRTTGVGIFKHVSSFADGEIDISGDLNIVENTTVNYGDKLRTGWDWEHEHFHRQLYVGNRWWDTEVVPGLTVNDEFIGVVGQKNYLISSYVYHFSSNDNKPRANANDTTSGAINISCDDDANDWAQIGTGDIIGFKQVWNISKCITFHVHYKLAKTTTQEFCIGLGQGNSLTEANFTGVRYNPRMYANHTFVVSNGTGLNTTVDLGVNDTDWHELWVHTCGDGIIFCFDDGNNQTVTTNIPANNETFNLIGYVKTYATDIKTFFLTHLIMTQRI